MCWREYDNFLFFGCGSEPAATPRPAEREKYISDDVIGLQRSLATNTLPIHETVGPLLKTTWGQAGVWQQYTPMKDGAPTYPGCTTIASAQLLYYYRYQNFARHHVCYTLEHDVTGNDVEDSTLCIPFETDRITYDWDTFAWSEEESASSIQAAASFIYHVGVTLNAQFGGGDGSSATGRQIENAFRYQWGFKKRRDQALRSRAVKIILKDG